MPLKSPMAIMAASLDATGQRQPEQSLDLMVCECCSTGLARANNGNLIAVWRDRSKTDIRDINISIRQTTDGKWTEPRLVHRDNWKMPS
jgi:predicted neuraminidase